MDIKFFILATISILMSCAGPAPDKHKRAVGLWPQKVLLKDYQGRYIRLEGEHNPILIADQKDVTTADTFYLIDLGRKIASLQSMKEQYVSVHLQKGNIAIARQTHIDSWEKLYIERSGNQVVFQSVANLQYLAPDVNNKNIITALFKEKESPKTTFTVQAIH